MMKLEPHNRIQGNNREMEFLQSQLKKSLLLMVLFVALLFVVACTPDQNDLFIQGSWFYNDMHIQEQVGESFEETIWIFDRGTYETYSCCFMEYHQYGRYDIVESQGDEIVLELFNINGRLNTERFQIVVTIDRQEDTIRVLRAGPFTRMRP